MSGSTKSKLTRGIGLLALTATGICSMLGASIYIVPFMIQKNVPGIGPYVLPAFLFAALPALFAAFAYAILASAMPRAGGSYIYASRGLHPYLGFIASFSQWFGLSIVIGVIAYMTIPFVRDIFVAIGNDQVAAILERGDVRVLLALTLIWGFTAINIRGSKSYALTLVPMMFLMFLLGSVVIICGLIYSQENFINAVQTKENRIITPFIESQFNWKIFLSASALLFSSFIGFDSIAQAGSEAKNPGRNLPKAILLSITIVGTFYFLFTASVYNIVPWNFVAEESIKKDISAAGLLSYILPPALGVAILAGAAISLINDLPAMLLSVSRLMFAWARDGIFPGFITDVHQKWHTPHKALILAGLMASIGIIGSHFAGDIFLGIDIMVTSMMVNFLLMCITLLSLPKVNNQISKNVTICKSRSIQIMIGLIGTLFLLFFLIIHTYKDLTSDVAKWYYHSTPVWMIVMGIGSLIYFINWSLMSKNGVDTKKLFKELPEE